MEPGLREIQSRHGANFEVESIAPVSFGNDEVAVQAAQEGVAIADRSHWGRFELTDRDRQTFLHNQSTNQIQSLQPGTGCDTVFVTSTARTLDLATVYVLNEAVRVVVSPTRREYLMQWLDRYIFFGDKVKLQDITESTAMFSLIGPASTALLQRLGVNGPGDAVYASHQSVTIAGQPVQVAVGSGLATEGYTLILEQTGAASLWSALVEAGAVPLGDRVWEQLRIQQGRPAPDHELTEDYNAVEACLWQAISINKGCYIGQETIARLDTYKGVKQQLWGLRLSQPVLPGAAILVNDEKVGVLTSVTPTANGLFGLGYVRTRAGGEGLQVQVEGQLTTLEDVPFLHRHRETP